VASVGGVRISRARISPELAANGGRQARPRLAFDPMPFRWILLSDLHLGADQTIAFVFGHTHKPHQQMTKIDGRNRWFPVYNTGGWVNEHRSQQDCHILPPDIAGLPTLAA
jgi:hypothetical protein